MFGNPKIRSDRSVLNKILFPNLLIKLDLLAFEKVASVWMCLKWNSKDAGFMVGMKLPVLFFLNGEKN